jgi:hypothetical protein
MTKRFATMGADRDRQMRRKRTGAPDLTSGHPARRATDLTAGLLARGSPPVTAFPGTVPVALWHELAADSCGGSCGFGKNPAPHSLFTLQAEETVKSRPIDGLFRALSMQGHYRPILPSRSSCPALCRASTSCFSLKARRGWPGQSPAMTLIVPGSCAEALYRTRQTQTLS